MDNDKSDRARFEELLSFYANETVSDVDRKWLESYLAVQLTAANSLQFERTLRQVVLQTRSSVPHQLRLERVLFESGLKPKNRSWLNRFFIVTSAENVAARWRQIAIPVPVFALATALFIGQVAFIGLNFGSASESLYRGATAQCADAVQLRVVFKPDARHEDVVLALRKIEATVRGGPSETGEIWISVPPNNSAEKAAEMLRSSATVDDVSVLVSKKEQEGCPKK